MSEQCAACGGPGTEGRAFSMVDGYTEFAGSRLCDSCADHRGTGLTWTQGQVALGELIRSRRSRSEPAVVTTPWIAIPPRSGKSLLMKQLTEQAEAAGMIVQRITPRSEQAGVVSVTGEPIYVGQRGSFEIPGYSGTGVIFGLIPDRNWVWIKTDDGRTGSGPDGSMSMRAEVFRHAAPSASETYDHLPSPREACAQCGSCLVRTATNTCGWCGIARPAPSASAGEKTISTPSRAGKNKLLGEIADRWRAAGLDVAEFKTETPGGSADGVARRGAALDETSAKPPGVSLAAFHASVERELVPLLPKGWRVITDTCRDISEPDAPWDGFALWVLDGKREVYHDSDDEPLAERRAREIADVIAVDRFRASALLASAERGRRV